MSIVLLTLMMMTAIPLLAVVPAAKPADDPTAEIIAMEKAMLARWGTGDTDSFLELAAPEITYFDPSLEKRLDGREAFEKPPRSRAFLIPVMRSSIQGSGLWRGRRSLLQRDRLMKGK
jgi:hypothetical protein